MAKQKPAVIVISSHVVRGTVGNRAAALALEVMGFPVWIVPTVTLPWHPGHGLRDRIVPADDQFSRLVEDLISAPWLNEVGAVLTGYLGSSGQVAPIARLLDAVKATNPDAQYILDPVIGDAPASGKGRLYVPEEQAAALEKHLLPRADIMTPNPFELSWLANAGEPSSIDDIHDAVSTLSCPRVLVTSAPAMMKDSIGNLLVQKENGPPKLHLAEHRRVASAPNGLGDLAAALMIGNLLEGRNPVQALQKMTASLFEVLSVTERAGSEELILESCIGSIINPRATITARPLLMKRR